MGECFRISITKNQKYKTGWVVSLIFIISLHQKDKAILESIQRGFNGVGSIIEYKDSIKVESIKELRVIIDHFDKYPLITQKRADFLLFKKAYELIENKEHLTVEGLKKLVAIKASNNLGLSLVLKQAYPDVEPVLRPLVTNQEISDPHWLAGFTSGEGCFYVNISNSTAYKAGALVNLSFTITQHKRDEQLLQRFIKYFLGQEIFCGTGKDIKIYSYRDAVKFVISKYSHLTEKIIPFFDKYPVQGEKVQDFNDFKRVALLMQKKAHLTKEGLEEIRQIKSVMNRGRDI